METRLRHTVTTRSVCGVIEPAVRHLANRIFMLTGGRQGSQTHRPTMKGFMRLASSLRFTNIYSCFPPYRIWRCHENPYPKTTRPEQVDLWIRPPIGGYETLLEAGDFTPKKLQGRRQKK